MRRPVACVLCSLLATFAFAPAAPAQAGGAQAPEGGSGGAEYGAPLVEAKAPRPVAKYFNVSPRTVTAGKEPPRITLRIENAGVRRVNARVVFWPLRGRGSVLRLDLGSVATGQVVRPRWPTGQALVAGSYVVRLHARGPQGQTLLRRAQASGRVPLTVKPAPVTRPVTGPTPTPVTPGGVFPVAGPHSLGGDGSAFGADRGDHSHEGHDVSAAAGTPVVAPLAGTITVRDYQADGAGFYLVQAASDGRHFFFAHCQKDTFAVAEGQTVAAGQQLCRVGSTGASSGPHLHFEIWVGGWRASKDSYPVDPLPQLQAWDR